LRRGEFEAEQVGFFFPAFDTGPQTHRGLALCLNRTGFAEGSNSCVGWTLINMTTTQYSEERRERGVRQLRWQGNHTSRWAAIESIALKIS
jgi:hypothetical protein